MQLIPRLFHQIWLGPSACPEEFAAFGQTWLALNPDWEMKLWTEQNLPDDLTISEIYQRLRVPAERSDLLRLEVLFRFGGVYVDTDFECLRPIGKLIEGLDFFVGDIEPERICNAIIGAVPQHRIIAHAIREAAPREFHGYSKKATGPLLLDRIVREYPGVKIFAPPVFYPITPGEVATASAHHHSARSWRPDGSFRKAAVFAEERLFMVQEQLLEAATGIAELAQRPEAVAVREQLMQLSSRLTYHTVRPHPSRGRQGVTAKFRAFAGRMKRAARSALSQTRTILPFKAGRQGRSRPKTVS